MSLVFSVLVMQFRQAKTEIVTASKVAYRFLAGIASDSPSNSSDGGTPRFQQPMWFKNLIAPGAKPSTSAELEDCNDSDADDEEEEKDRHRPRQDPSPVPAPASAPAAAPAQTPFL